MGWFAFSVSLFSLFLLTILLMLVGYFLVQGFFTVPWVRTRGNMSRRMLELAGFVPGMRVLDLGSGDGAIVFQAVAMGGKGIGMERLWLLVWYARLRSLFFGQDHATFVRGDIFQDELPQADIVTTYLFSEVNARLEPRLQSQYPVGTKIVSRDFVFPNLRKLCSERYGNSTLHVYEI